MGGLFAKPAAAAAIPSQIPTTRWELVQRPAGLLKEEDVIMRSDVIDTTTLLEGEAVVEVEMLSVDAFLRTMLDEKAYHGAINLGATLPALGYGKVVASANAKLKVGARVMGMMGAASVTKVTKENAAMMMPMLSLPYLKPTTFLGLLGMTSGLTAHVGIHSVTRPPRRGQTALISGASGATGSVAAQLSKLTGARTIGVAGGPKKQKYVTEMLGCAACIDYKSNKPVGEQLDEACPDGIDFYFDTVGGELLDEVLKRMKRGGRVVICGASSQYNGNLNVGTVRGPSEYLKLAERGATMVGYNVMFYFHKLPFAMLHMLWLMLRKKIFMTEQVEKGIASFCPAMIKMFTGGHIGKLLVSVGPSDAAATKTLKAA